MYEKIVVVRDYIVRYVVGHGLEASVGGVGLLRIAEWAEGESSEVMLRWGKWVAAWQSRRLWWWGGLVGINRVGCVW